jgi:hypothetical protein
MTDVLIQPILRGWTKSTKPVKTAEPRPRTRYRPKDEKFLAFDTETTFDAIQGLRFGCFAYGLCRKDGSAEIYDRGIFLADEPVPGDEKAAEVIARYAEVNGVLFMTAQEFCERYLWKHGCKGRATVIGFNLPFDISRVAVRAVESRKKDDAFSFRIFRDKSGKEYGMRPSITVKKLGAKKQSIQWGSYKEPNTRKGPEKRWSSGAFIDVHQAVAAHNGGASFTLGACAELYGTEHKKTGADYAGEITPEYLDYCLNDVAVTVEVYQAVLRQHLDRRSGTPLAGIYSTASLSKALMDDLGVIPPLAANPDFPPAILGLAMSAFIGARTEAHVVNVPVPGQLLDFTSMYPTIGSLMGLTRFLRCETIRVEDATAEVRGILEGVSLDGCFDKSLWPDMCGIALVKPGSMLTVPVRANYGGSGTQVSVSHFTPGEALPYSIPDLVAACLLDGKAPEIAGAWRFVPEGQSGFLMKARLPGNMTLDIRHDDLFRTLVELRNGYKAAHCKGHGSELECIQARQCENCSVSLYLKILSNALYGIFAEMNPQTARGKDTVYTKTVGSGNLKFTAEWKESWTAYAHGKPVHGLDLKKPEVPGRFCFPPLAMLFTSGARLMLAMLERCVTDAGGTYAMMDTDSMFIVSGSTETESGTVQGISREETDAIAERFQELSPYSQATGSIRLLKREYPKDEGEEGWCIAISSKRYALFRRSGEGLEGVEVIDSDSEDDYFRIDKRSEHGLGYLMSPAKNWRDEAWKWIIANKIRGFYRVDIPRPEWFDLPAIGQHTITTPWLLDAFTAFNDGKSYQQQVKPFNFMSVAYQPVSVKPGARLRLVAPLITDAGQAMSAPWFDLYSGKPHTVALAGSEGTGDVAIKSFAAVMHEYLRHAERKAGTQDGCQATGRTQGQLRRLNLLQVLSAKVQGRDTNEREEQAVHLKTEEETTLVYSDVDTDSLVRYILAAHRLSVDSPNAVENAVIKAMEIVQEHGITAGSPAVALKIAADIIRKGGSRGV